MSGRHLNYKIYRVSECNKKKRNIKNDYQTFDLERLNFMIFVGRESPSMDNVHHIQPNVVPFPAFDLCKINGRKLESHLDKPPYQSRLVIELTHFKCCGIVS